MRAADEPTVRLLDGFVGFWIVLWLVLGAWSAHTVWQLSHLGDTVTRSGQALRSAGEALQAVGELPVVGERSLELGGQIVATAGDIQRRGQEVEADLRRLAALLGLSIVLIPTTPVVGLYLPARVARHREVGELARALAAHRDDAGLDRYLAERALNTLPYSTVRAITHDPWHDIATGHARALADAELARLGLRRRGGNR